VLARSGQTPPSDRFNVAGIGIGGMGRSNMLALASQNIVALCDVDWNYAGEAWSEQRFDDQIAQLEARLKEPPQQATDAQFGRLSAEQVRARAQQQLEDLKRVRESLPRIKRYVDYREMLEKQKDIDGVVIATPDHLHAIQAVAAMDLGKHVYVQKPLTWSVAEARLLAKKARETKVATQMGNQGHSSNDARLVNEYIWAGTI